MKYYWGEPDTLVTWCEEKYNVTNYISEFWNSITNIFYLIVAYNTYSPKNKLLTFYISLLSFGSFMFHSTSRYYFQLLDEIPMLLLINEILYLFYGKTKFTNCLQLRKYLNLSTSTNICIYLIIKNYNYFLFVFTINILMVLLVSFNYRHGNRKYLYLSIGSMTAGKILWEIEQNYCYYNKFFYLLHGFWHLFSSISLNYIIKFVIN